MDREWRDNDTAEPAALKDGPPAVTSNGSPLAIDDTGVTILHGIHSGTLVPWNEITGAGLMAIDPRLAKARVALPENVPLVSNALESLEDRIEHMLPLVIGRRHNGHRSAVSVQVRPDNPADQAVLAQLQQRLGGRWLGTDRSMTLYRRLGGRSPWWIVPATLTGVVGVLALGLVVVFVIAVIGAGLETALDAVMPHVAWLIVSAGGVALIVSGRDALTGDADTGTAGGWLSLAGGVLKLVIGIVLVVVGIVQTLSPGWLERFFATPAGAGLIVAAAGLGMILFGWSRLLSGPDPHQNAVIAVTVNVFSRLYGLVWTIGGLAVLLGGLLYMVQPTTAESLWNLLAQALWAVLQRALDAG